MSANNIVVFEERADGTFNAFHRNMDYYCEGQYDDRFSAPDAKEQPIFSAATMRECVEKFNEWIIKENWNIEYSYVFELRAGNEANPS